MFLSFFSIRQVILKVCVDFIWKALVLRSIFDKDQCLSYISYKNQLAVANSEPLDYFEISLQ